MASITSDNEDDTIMAHIQKVLEEATIAGDRVFERAQIFGSREEINEVETTDSPIVGIVYESTETWDLPGLEVGCVITIELLIAINENDNILQSREITRVVNATRNILHSNIPSTANGFGEEGDGEYHHRMFIDTPERDEEAEEPWAIMFLPVEVAYRRATDISH